MLRALNTKRGRCGQAVVELALILPVLLVVLLGVMEFGIVFMRQNALTNAAREGARKAVLPTVTDGEVTALVTGILTGAGLEEDKIEVSVTNEGETGSPGADVTVSLTYGHQILTGSILGIGTTINLSSNCVMRHE